MTINRNRYTDQKEFDLDYVFTFGKYKHITLLEILERDPEYIEWCLENVDNFAVTDEIEEAIQDEEWREILLDDHR